MKQVDKNLLKIGMLLFFTFFFIANPDQAHAYYGFPYGGYTVPNLFNAYPYGGYGLPYNIFNGNPYGFGWNPYGYSNLFFPATFLSGYSPYFFNQLLNSFNIPLIGIPWNPSIPVEDLYANDPTPTDPEINPYYSPPPPSEYKWFPGIGWTTIDGVFYNPITGGYGGFTS